MRSMRSGRAVQRGLSFVELLVTCCIGSVLTAMAVPSLKSAVSARAMAVEMAELTEDLRFARMKAMASGQKVSVCARRAPSPGQRPSCKTQGQDWSDGWLVFSDRDADGQVDAEDILWRELQRTAQGGTVTSRALSLTFQANGISSKANTSVKFAPAGAKPAAGTEGHQVVCINKPGRARVVQAPSCS